MLLTVSFKVEGDVEQLAREVDVLLDPYPFVRIAALRESKTLIVTDLSSNLRKIANLVDGPIPPRSGFAGRFIRNLDSPPKFADKEKKLIVLTESEDDETRRTAVRRLKSLRTARRLVIEAIESDVAIAKARLDKAMAASESAKKYPGNYSRSELQQIETDGRLRRVELKTQVELSLIHI